MADNLAMLLRRLFPVLRDNIAAPLTGQGPACILFFSVSNGQSRASVITAQGENLGDAWRQGSERIRKIAKNRRLDVQWLRVDQVDMIEESTWGKLKLFLGETKRNYFRNGISLDPKCRHAFLETELNANAMLYGGPKIAHCVVNEKNFLRYARSRHALGKVNFSDDKPVWCFSSHGLIVEDGEEEVHHLYESGPNAGRRIIEQMAVKDVRSLIENGSSYLGSQVNENGRFRYGRHPCFARTIEAYNCLRHASSLYALIEAWEITDDANVMEAIKRGLAHLTDSLIERVTLPSGERAAFLVDVGNEIKLGGNAVCILALVKYTELTGDKSYLPLLEELATGILSMQDKQSGAFVHVLHYPSLEVKAPFRIIYYDGEAAFGLMLLFNLTGDKRWLEAVERAFEHFIREDHWKAHDHWLSYCVNELTRHRPERRYFEFGIRNFAGYLDFVLNRITTFPTLLELMMAAEQMIGRLQDHPERDELLAQVDLAKFHRALHKRAHHMLNGHFWPELAMYYEKPAEIVGSFFIRHHAFRVRIDDVEHYLSGYVAYLKYLSRSSSLTGENHEAKADMLTRPDPAQPSPNTVSGTDNAAIQRSQRQLESTKIQGHQNRRRMTLKSSEEIMFAKLANFQVDVAQLQNHFHSYVEQQPSTAYRDNRVDYIGWAVTSRDGSTVDGVRRIAPKTGSTRGVTPTDVCHGYLAETMQRLSESGTKPYRARIMQLESERGEMPFHVDSRQETWRLHIPIITNANSFFEWQRADGSTESVHLPADGSAWLVRVDISHRAVNRSAEPSHRVHLLMGLGKSPELDMLSEPWLPAKLNQTA